MHETNEQKDTKWRTEERNRSSCSSEPISRISGPRMHINKFVQFRLKHDLSLNVLWCSFFFCCGPKKPTQTINNLTIFSCQFCCSALFWLIVIWWFWCLFALSLSSFAFALFNSEANTENAHKCTLSLSLSMHWCIIYSKLFSWILIHSAAVRENRATTKRKTKHEMTTYVSFWKWMKSHNEFDIFCKKNIMKNGIQIDWKTAAAVVCFMWHPQWDVLNNSWCTHTQTQREKEEHQVQYVVELIVWAVIKRMHIRVSLTYTHLHAMRMH